MVRTAYIVWSLLTPCRILQPALALVLATDYSLTGFAEAADEKPAEPVHAAEKLKEAIAKPSEKLGAKLKKRLSARHHHNEGMTLNHTHTRSKFRPGSLHHFEHMERVGSAHAHMFNLFRLSGDFLHLGAFGFLLYHLHSTKSCEGISFRTQAMYL